MGRGARRLQTWEDVQYIVGELQDGAGAAVQVITELVDYGFMLNFEANWEQSPTPFIPTLRCSCRLMLKDFGLIQQRHSQWGWAALQHFHQELLIHSGEAAPAAPGAFIVESLPGRKPS